MVDPKLHPQIYLQSQLSIFFIASTYIGQVGEGGHKSDNLIIYQLRQNVDSLSGEGGAEITTAEAWGIVGVGACGASGSGLTSVGGEACLKVHCQLPLASCVQL